MPYKCIQVYYHWRGSNALTEPFSPSSGIVTTVWPSRQFHAKQTLASTSSLKNQLRSNLPSETDSGAADNARHVTVPEIVAECDGSQLSMRSTSLESMVRVNSHGVCLSLLFDGSYVPTIFSVKRIPGFSLTKLASSANKKRYHVCSAHTKFSLHFNKMPKRFCFLGQVHLAI